jgi:hypothetical protein
LPRRRSGGLGRGRLARSGSGPIEEAVDRPRDHIGSDATDRAVEVDPRLAELATNPDRHRLASE